MTDPASTGRGQESADPRGRFALSVGLLVATAAMGVGILAAITGIRLPFMHLGAPRVADVISQTISSKGVDAAVAQYRSLRERGFPELSESESDMNALGYQLLRKGEKNGAIQVFQLNVETHPKSANPYDSLGEAFAAAGNNELAIESYQKALALDPNMKSAANALHKLTGSPAKPYHPLVLVHICAGILGLLSGAAALTFRKGSRWHRMAGNVFLISMLTMSSIGIYRALLKSQTGNVFGGALAFYLVTTAWVTARRREGVTGIFDWGALLVALAIGAGMVVYGLEAANSPTGLKDGIPAAPYFIFGCLAMLSAAGDVRMLAGGGIFGAQRIVRHLWRMCFALFIGAASLFVGQQQVFADSLRETNLLIVPPVLVLILMIFWLSRVLFTNAYKGMESTLGRRDVGAL